MKLARARLCILTALLSTLSAAFPCMTIALGGVPVSVASETAIIVWDEKTHEEQFIRLANFATDAKDLGFLVPTATPPTF